MGIFLSAVVGLYHCFYLVAVVADLDDNRWHRASICIDDVTGRLNVSLDYNDNKTTTIVRQKMAAKRDEHHSVVVDSFMSITSVIVLGGELCKIGNRTLKVT